ncbi:unnamed protein product [Cuscuta europaea]|uniref:Leucine-rich repeat-containing N-terminal plant-type domain-containing protein n=1 Tax=Cuscuta europaea TaxID=41803 RepID=A0A9P0ZXT3_CUSEU|nr:unnamed protein product [Cuscuta europaea]
MEPSLSPTLVIYCLLIIIQGAVSDLKADREVLLDFASAVGGETRRWSIGREAPICNGSYWVGVKCNPEGSRVAELLLPGMGLSGEMPENTIERLDALRALNLENNSLMGSLPPDLNLPHLRHLNLSNNHFGGSIPTSLAGFPPSSFAGNVLLCGPPLLNHQCRPLHRILNSKSSSSLSKCKPKHSKKCKKQKYIVYSGVAAGGVGAVCICICVCICVRRKSR